MAKAAATFDDLLQITPPGLRPLAARLRALVLAVDADACESVRLGDRAATYGVGQRKMLDGYVYIMPHRRWVNLGFYQGAGLSDPEGLLEGSGVRLRHIKIRKAADAERPAITALLHAAVAERRSARAKR